MPVGELLTIVIPTRERCGPLRQAILSCLRCHDERLRVLVSDNASTDDTARVVGSFSDSRLSYFNTGRRLCMTANWEFALDKVESGYVIFIGDDDAAVTEHLPRLLRFLDEHQPSALRTILPEYYWHDHPNPLMRGLMKNLCISTSAAKIDAGALLKHLAQVPDANFFSKRLPSFYHGCVHTGLIDCIRARNGTVLHSNCPDLYSGAIVAAEAGEHWILDWPVTVNALSARSTGASSLHAKDRTNEQQFWQEAPLPMHPRLCDAVEGQILSRAPPLLVADNLLRAHEKNPAVPEPDLQAVVDLCVKLATRKNTREDHDTYLAAARSVAERNGLALPRKAELRRFVPRPSLRETNRYEARSHTFQVLDLTPFGATDALSAAETLVKITGSLSRQSKARQQTFQTPSGRRTKRFAPAHYMAEMSLLALQGQLTGLVLDEMSDLTRRQKILSPPNLAEGWLPWDANDQQSHVSDARVLLMCPRGMPGDNAVATAKTARACLQDHGAAYLPLIPEQISAWDEHNSHEWSQILEKAGFAVVTRLQVHGNAQARLLTALCSRLAVQHSSWRHKLAALFLKACAVGALHSVRQHPVLSLGSGSSGLFTILEARPKPFFTQP